MAHTAIILHFQPGYADYNRRQHDGLKGSPGKSQGEGQEDQETLKQLMGFPLAVGPLVLPLGFSPGSLSTHHTALYWYVNLSL
jgi:hypothetical protein